ncbi:Com family DNA-binding transcriptional regulator [Prosthecomicrobium hirschii]|uniref:Com family DNA-binding transcriptional regulator n=1 Tax=Prosthecodimorpha hirschii TaxID=665126 RepID=UPI003B8A8A89
METVRCGYCDALLFKARGSIGTLIEIKCRRCGTLNHLRPAEPSNDRQERPDRGDPCRGSMSRRPR